VFDSLNSPTSLSTTTGNHEKKLIASFHPVFTSYLQEIWHHQPDNGPIELEEIAASTYFCSAANELFTSNPGVKFVYFQTQDSPNMFSWPFHARLAQNKPDILGLIKLFEKTRCPHFPNVKPFKVKIIWTTRDIRECLQSTVYHRKFASFSQQAFWLQTMLINLHSQISALPLCSWTRIEYSNKFLEDKDHLTNHLVPQLASWLNIRKDVLLNAILQANTIKNEYKSALKIAFKDQLRIPSEAEQALNDRITRAYFGPPHDFMWPLMQRPDAETVSHPLLLFLF
jgi:hypothetical protein